MSIMASANESDRRLVAKEVVHGAACPTHDNELRSRNRHIVGFCVSVTFHSGLQKRPGPGQHCVSAS